MWVVQRSTVLRGGKADWRIDFVSSCCVTVMCQSFNGQLAFCAHQGTGNESAEPRSMHLQEGLQRSCAGWETIVQALQYEKWGETPPHLY